MAVAPASNADIVAHSQAVASIPGNRREAYRRALEESLSNNRMSALLAGATATYEAEEYPFFSIALPVWRERTQELAERILYALFPQGEETIEQAQEWLEGDGTNAPSALRKIVLDGLDSRLRDKRVRDTFAGTTRFLPEER